MYMHARARARAHTHTGTPLQEQSRELTSHTHHSPPSQSGIRYPVVVRFENQNYAGVSTNNYGLDEVTDPPSK